MKKKVLFVCVGNSCRSQMAEGFARAYGTDVLEPASCGLAPATMIMPLTRQVMLEKNIPLDGNFPKGFELLGKVQFDIAVNISGYPLPKGAWTSVREWRVADPVGRDEKYYRHVRDELERLVMNLILDLRRQSAQQSPPQI